MPLYALALESQTQRPILVDNDVVALTKRLDEQFAHSDTKFYRRLAAGRLPKTLLTTMALKFRHIDSCVREFLHKQPDAVIVTLGCGLDDRQCRVDNGRLTWVNLDVPEVMDLRTQCYEEGARTIPVASSVLDHAWFERIPQIPGTKVLFIAEGLFMYLPKPAVRELIKVMSERFTGAQMIVELASQQSVDLMHTALGRGKLRRQFSLSENVVYECGVADEREMETWSPHIRFIDRWSYFQENEPKLGLYKLAANVDLFRWLQWTGRYRFGE